MVPTAQFYGPVPAWVFLWLAVALSLGIFAYRVRILYRLLRLGQPENRFDRIPDRISSFIVDVILQRRVAEDRWTGMAHVFIFWGFLVLLLSTANLFVEGLTGGAWSLPVVGYNQYFSFLGDIFAALVALAIVAAAARRYLFHPARLQNTLEAGLILSLIFLLMITLFVAEGVASTRGQWMPVSTSVAGLLASLGMDRGAELGLATLAWWGHLLGVLTFAAYIPFSKHLHLLACPVNEAFRSFEHRGVLSTLDLENTETFGVSTVNQFTWKQLLDTYACTECGRCLEGCPAHQSGKELAPRELIHGIKLDLLTQGPQLLAAKKANGSAQAEAVEVALKPVVPNALSEEALWACTTCMYCQYHCPVYIEHLPKIVDLRRDQVLMQSTFPSELRNVFKNLEVNANPWEIAWSNRAQWATDLEVPVLGEGGPSELLYWVGCAGSYDDRSQKVSRAFVQVLKAAGVPFSILGAEEKCCGDPARRLGNEYVFQSLAMENVELMKGYGVKKIVTQCPHCLNTLKNEYPQFGGEFEVVHHTQLIADLIQQGKLKPSAGETRTVVYHDSCYLGRYNGIYDAPREVLRSLPSTNLVEMEKRREKAFCCGGGGGRAFMEEHSGQRINQMRFDQATATGAEVIASACPFCLTMFEDARVARDAIETVRTLDIAELIAASLPRQAEASASSRASLD